MVEVITYALYVGFLLGLIFIFQFVHLKLERIRLKHRLLIDLMEHNYETNKIDLNEFLNK